MHAALALGRRRAQLKLKLPTISHLPQVRQRSCSDILEPVPYALRGENEERRRRERRRKGEK